MPDCLGQVELCPAVGGGKDAVGRPLQTLGFCYATIQNTESYKPHDHSPSEH